MNWLKNQGVKLFQGVLKMHQPYSRLLAFILKIFLCSISLLIMLPILSGVFTKLFGQALSVSDLILLVTAVFVLAYTYETYKLKEESVFARRISGAVDVHFTMKDHYLHETPINVFFGELKSPESLNNVSKFIFLSAILAAPIGRSSNFQKLLGDTNSHQASYFIDTVEERNKFLKALQLQNGEIKAFVLITSGERFIYTYRATHDNWKKTLDGAPNLNDSFILVKKELDAS